MTQSEKKKQATDRPASFEDFLNCLNEVIAGEDVKSRLPNAVRLIGKGFGPYPQYRPKMEEIEQVEQRLRAVFDPTEVGLRLWAQKAKKHAFLLRDLRNMFTTRVRCDLAISPVTNDDEFDQRSAELSQMVRATNSEAELVAFMRKAVIALAGEQNSAARSQLLYEVLDQAADHRTRKFDATNPTSKHGPHEEQLAEAIRIVSKTKVDFKTVVAARKLALPMHVEIQERRRTADLARRDKVVAEEAQRAAEAKSRGLQDRVNELESQLVAHQARLRQNETEIEMEKRKSNEIRETLTTRHAHELDGKLRQMAKALMLELEETQICLDRDEPNAKMALNRVRDMQSILNPYMEN